MRVSAAEREVVIQWAGTDNGLAHIYSAQLKVMRKLAKHPGARNVVPHWDDRGRLIGLECDLPLPDARALIPAKKRQVSEAQREAARRRMKAVRRVPARQPDHALEAGSTTPKFIQKPSQDNWVLRGADDRQ